MFGDTPLIMVEDDESLVRVCEKLGKEDVLAIDTESDSFHSYQEKVCLIQLSGPECDYIVDPLKVDDLSPLKALLEDDDILKLLHGGDYDVVCMKRDFDIGLHPIFDTMIAGQFLGFDKIGLADLIRKYFGIKLDKKYQRHDWSARPLRHEHLQYARGDTHWLMALHEVLEHRLQGEGLSEAAAEECALLEEREWSGREPHASDFLRVKKAKRLDDDSKRVLRAVWEYREEQAREKNRPAFKTIPGQVLIALARKKPTELSELADIVRERSSTYRRHGAALIEAVQAGIEDTRPIPEIPRKKRKKKKRRGPTNDRLMSALRTWRNKLCDQEGLSPVVVANNKLLKDIAAAEPETLEALGELADVRDWQVEQYGADIIAMVHADKEARAARKKKKRRKRKKRRSDDAAASSQDQGE